MYNDYYVIPAIARQGYRGPGLAMIKIASTGSIIRDEDGIPAVMSAASAEQLAGLMNEGRA